MTDHPIQFRAPMIRALLDGRKTQTRQLAWRILPTEAWMQDEPMLVGGKPTKWQKVQPGDRLWVSAAYDCFSVYFRTINFGAGKYAVGTDGLVYDVTNQPRACASHKNHNGYEEITLRHRGEQRAFRVNRLVAEAFYGPPPFDGAITRHMDGNRSNNTPQNLDWGTAAQNTADANASGQWSGENNGSAKLAAADIAAIRGSTEPQATLASRFGVTQPTISKIKSGKRWRAEHPAAPERNFPAWKPWGSSIYCPRWASRLTLIVTAIRIERLYEISNEDAIAEGIERNPIYTKMKSWLDYSKLSSVAGFTDPRLSYRTLWISINGPESWDANPEVVVISFDVVKENIDKIAARR